MSASEQATRKYSCTNPKAATAVGRVVRVENAGEIFGCDAAENGTEEVAVVELVEVEEVRGSRAPQSQRVNGSPTVADNRPVVGHAE